MKETTTDIYQVNNSFFHKIFDTPENARDFLEKVLPECWMTAELMEVR